MRGSLGFAFILLTLVCCSSGNSDAPGSGGSAGASTSGGSRGPGVSGGSAGIDNAPFAGSGGTVAGSGGSSAGRGGSVAGSGGSSAGHGGSSAGVGGTRGGPMGGAGSSGAAGTTGGTRAEAGDGGRAGAAGHAVSCGDETCGADQYCKAACSGTSLLDAGPPPVLKPSCAPLPAACNGTPSCDCICGPGSTFCTPGAKQVQCGCG